MRDAASLEKQVRSQQEPSFRRTGIRVHEHIPSLETPVTLRLYAPDAFLNVTMVDTMTFGTHVAEIGSFIGEKAMMCNSPAATSD